MKKAYTHARIALSATAALAAVALVRNLPHHATKGRIRTQVENAAVSVPGRWTVVDAHGYYHYFNTANYTWYIDGTGSALYIINPNGTIAALFYPNQYVCVEPTGTADVALPK